MADEATRCPCGDNADQEGFMIQCEACSVWQHGECVGVLEETVPEEYYCELCMPEHEIHQNRRKLMALMKVSKKGHRKTPRGKDKDKNRGEKRKRGDDGSDTPKQRKRERHEPPPSPLASDKPMSREERKLKQILETIKKLEGGGDNNRRAPSTPTSSPRVGAVPKSPRVGAVPKSPRVKPSPRPAPKASPKASPKPSSKPSPKPSPKAAPDGVLRSGRQRATHTPTPRSFKRRRATPATNKKSKDSKGGSLNTSRAARTARKQPQTRFPRRQLLPLTPMYLGHKRWLTATVQREQRAHDKLLGGTKGLHAHMSSCALPLSRRLLGAYTADQLRQGEISA